MRVLLVVPPSRARLHALVPLGWAFRTGGHGIEVAGPAPFAEEITATGFVAVAESDVDDLIRYAELWRPNLVVFDVTAPGAEVARRLGVEGLRVLGPYDEEAPGPRDRGTVGLDLLPASLRSGDSPLRFVHYAGPEVLPSWLRRPPRRRRVYVCGGVPASAVAGLCEAVTGMDVELVCAAAVPAATRIPTNVRVFEAVPEPAVLATCAAVVHDGDPALAMAAAARGLPQLAVSGGWLADRIAAVGAGVVAATVDKAVLDVLVNDPAQADGAARLGAEITAMPDPRTVVADRGSSRRT
jgi:UDP:flavonoid glycosyltransferase YjiC (YdhE family)